MNELTADNLIAAARSYLGVRFIHQGRERTGLDCVGLVVRAVTDCGGRPRDCRTYRRLPQDETMHRLLAEQLDRAAVDEARRGDVLALHLRGGYRHCAIVTEVLEPGRAWQIIHALVGRGVVEHRLDGVWLAQHHAEIATAYRLREVEA
jgi:hypothetical protein